MDQTFCADSIPNFLKIFDLSIAPQLLFYTYIPVILIALFLALFVYRKSKNLEGQLFTTIAMFFALWVIDVLMLWIVAYNSIIMFSWQLTPILEVPLFIFSIHFTYVATSKEQKDISLKLKSFFIGIMTFIIVLLPTSFNILFYNINPDVCEGVPGVLWDFIYIFEMITMVWISGLCIKRYQELPKTDPFRKKIIYLGGGIVAFLILFTSTNILGQITGIQEISLWDSLGMVFFLSSLVLIIVRFKEFNIKLIATQALVWGLIALIGSQFFFIDVFVNFILNGIGFLGAIILGQFLIRSVKKEVQQKEELAKLNIDLQDLLKQRESLVHLVTHKVKGSFTRSKYIFAGILDGSFGETSGEIKKVAEQGLESDNMGIETVDLVLNVANMQKGTVKYEMKPINLREIVEKSMTEKKIVAESKGLVIQNNIRDGVYNILGDAFWMKEAINNLLENSIKYTKSGSITIDLQNQNKKVIVSVKDTGVGITDEDKKGLFTEGGRGKDSVKVNVDSTGYGLYSVKLIIDAHKGRVWAESEGPGKGSIFYIELDAA